MYTPEKGEHTIRRRRGRQLFSEQQRDGRTIRPHKLKQGNETVRRERMTHKGRTQGLTLRLNFSFGTASVNCSSDRQRVQRAPQPTVSGQLQVHLPRRFDAYAPLEFSIYSTMLPRPPPMMYTVHFKRRLDGCFRGEGP